MRQFYFYVFLLIFCLVEADDQESGYYWREYNGVVPPDAISAGKDINGFETYIGQAYFHQQGIIPTQIFPGQEEVELALFGVKKVKQDIKILCSPQKKHFEWMQTSNKYFQLNTTDRHLVTGGFDAPNKGVLNIGRLTFQGELKVGKISSYVLENAIFHFPHNNIEFKANLYEVLLYNGLPVYDLDIRQSL